jgi:hypothetical protein
MPDMSAFDAPSREVCTVKRTTTTTPQQAFVLLNDVQFVEAARVLAERMLKECGSGSKEKITFAFQRLAGRAPDPTEMKLLLELLQEQSDRFRQSRDRAENLISVGDRKRDPSLDPVELAANTILAQTIMNLDATVWKR